MGYNMKTKRDWDALVIELVSIAKEKQGLKEENAMLADENIKFARYMRELGYTTTEIDNIAKGFDL